MHGIRLSLNPSSSSVCCGSLSSSHFAWKIRSFIEPRTLRWTVAANAMGSISEISASMARVGAPNACSTSAKPLRKRGINVDSSFTGMKTDKSVGSLTKMRSRCRRTNSRLMYQSPSLVVDTGASAMVSIPNRRSTRCVHLKVSTFHLSRAELEEASPQFLLPLLDRSNLTSCCDLR